MLFIPPIATIGKLVLSLHHFTKFFLTLFAFGFSFDLKNDPDEFNDLGKSEKHSKIREEMKELLLKR